MTSVAAVVVTFNRKQLVTACIAKLLEQTRPVDRLYIIDNASTDGTHEHLSELGYTGHARITYVRLDSNTGGAGGFHEGMRLAHAAGHDWIWIMDDDGEPREDTLALIEAQFDTPEVVALLPMIADSVGDPDFSAPHRGFMLPPEQMREDVIARPVTPDEFARGPILPIDIFSFVGPCFPRWVIDRAGLPRKEFFIHFDDIEYALRIGAMGRSLLVCDARILHREAQMATLVERKTRFGRQSNRIRFNALWLRYFGYRNLAWLKLQGTIPGSRMSLLVSHLRVLLRVLIYDDHKWKRLRFWNGAFADAWAGRFDNAKPRKILND